MMGLSRDEHLLRVVPAQGPHLGGQPGPGMPGQMPGGFPGQPGSFPGQQPGAFPGGGGPFGGGSYPGQQGPGFGEPAFGGGQAFAPPGFAERLRVLVPVLRAGTRLP